MKIIFQDSNEIVEEAVEKANILLQDPLFFKAIAEKDSFDLSSAPPSMIATLLQESDLQFAIELFYPNSITERWKYRKTLGYSDPRYPNTLFLNLKKLHRSLPSIVATIIHESIHALDHASKEYTFGHGNNSSVGKENTAPYWIGNLALKMLSGDATAEMVFDEDDDTELQSLDFAGDFVNVLASWKPIVGKGFTVSEFAKYCAGLRWDTWRPNFIVLHNTASPTLSDRPYGFSEQHMRNFEDFYKNQRGWSAGPHLFIDDHRIWVFTPLTTSGVHSPSWNNVSLGVEMLGDYEKEPFNTGRGLAVRKNAVAAIATLCSILGFDSETLRLHKEDKATTHNCPGKNVVKSQFIEDVKVRMCGATILEHTIA